MLIGYARISTSDQSINLQTDALKVAGCEQVFSDTVSGNKSRRPGLDEALKFVRDGDTLVVWKLDRLGRSLNHLLQTIDALHKRGIGFKSLSDPIDTTTSTGKLILGIFGSLAEFELSLIKERTLAGLKAARARGRNGGRKRILSREQINSMLTLYESKKHSVTDICAQMQISRKSFYNYLEREKSSPVDELPDLAHQRS
jgi:DNA invertase Pin-like site-specific DNA recombinase